MGIIYSSDSDESSFFGGRRVFYGGPGFGGYDSEDEGFYGWRSGSRGSHGRRAEKSAAAIRREDEAKRIFDGVRKRVDAAYARAKQRVVRLGTRDDSGSPLNTLPEDIVEAILDFTGDFTPRQDLNKPLVPVAAAAAAVPSSSAVAVSAASLRSKRKRGGASKTASSRAAAKGGGKPAAIAPAPAPPPPPPEKCGMDRLCRIYEPGRQHVIQLLDPSCHLTGPCWRDVGRHVRSKPMWNIKRTAATPQEKILYKETRQGTVYFVNAIFTVPGIKKKPPRKRKRPSTPKAAGARKMEVAAKKVSQGGGSFRFKEEDLEAMRRSNIKSVKTQRTTARKEPGKRKLPAHVPANAQPGSSFPHDFFDDVVFPPTSSAPSRRAVASAALLKSTSAANRVAPTAEMVKYANAAPAVTNNVPASILRITGGVDPMMIARMAVAMAECDESQPQQEEEDAKPAAKKKARRASSRHRK